MGAISSNGTANMSCSTKASRSAGARVSRTTSSASPTESASTASCSGSPPSAGPWTGSVDVLAERILAPRGPGAQHVQADPRDDGGQPAVQVPHIAGVGPAQPQPRLLHGVFGLARRPEHPVGHRPQVGAAGLELLGQHVVFVHRCHCLPHPPHPGDESDPDNVTGDPAQPSANRREHLGTVHDVRVLRAQVPQVRPVQLVGAVGAGVGDDHRPEAVLQRVGRAGPDAPGRRNPGDDDGVDAQRAQGGGQRGAEERRRVLLDDHRLGVQRRHLRHQFPQVARVVVGEQRQARRPSGRTARRPPPRPGSARRCGSPGSHVRGPRPAARLLTSTAAVDPRSSGLEGVKYARIRSISTNAGRDPQPRRAAEVGGRVLGRSQPDRGLRRRQARLLLASFQQLLQPRTHVEDRQLADPGGPDLARAGPSSPAAIEGAVLRRRRRRTGAHRRR